MLPCRSSRWNHRGRPSVVPRDEYVHGAERRPQSQARIAGSVEADLQVGLEPDGRFHHRRSATSAQIASTSPKGHAPCRNP